MPTVRKFEALPAGRGAAASPTSDLFDEVAASPGLIRPERTDLLRGPVPGVMTVLAIAGRALCHAISAGDLTPADARALLHSTTVPLLDAWNRGEPWPGLGEGSAGADRPHV